ncbi:MAG: hypothetical protein J0L75_19610 [Spirochaetes bacterium]|nr:hypothetical protein [Spirochaetota bacterium]
MIRLRRSILLLAIPAALVLAGCDQATFGKGLPKVKSVLIVSMRLQNGSLQDEEPVKYPSIHFIGDAFRTNFISEWNEKFGDRLALRSPTNDDEKLLFPRPAVGAAESTRNASGEARVPAEEPIWMRDNLDRRRYPTMDVLLDRYGCDAWATLEGEVSLWRQTLKGTAKVYDRGGNLVWKQSFKAVSTYIIKDDASPYLSDFDQILDTLEKQRSHKGEILQVAGELGRQAVREMHKAYERVVKRPLPKAAGTR